MKQPIIAIAVAVLAALALALPAGAWHVTTEPGSAEATVKSIGPRGDPKGRIVVKHKTAAYGYVVVPDKPWAQGSTFIVEGKGATAGERIRLRAGRCYTGRWVNARRVRLAEVEHFCIRDASPTAVVVSSHVHRRSGERVNHVYRVPRGCAYRSGWHAIGGGSWMWVKDKTTREFLMGPRRMAPDGWYGRARLDFRRGLTCPS